MSVTTLIAELEVRARLESLVARLVYRRSAPNRPTVVRRSTDVAPSIIGTAFDYALRFRVSRVARQVREGEWIAEIAARGLAERAIRERRSAGGAALRYRRWLLASAKSAEQYASAATKRIIDARRFVADYVRLDQVTESIERDLCAHALRLARLDPYYRAGVCDETILTEDTPTTIDDLRNLLAVAPTVHSPGERVWLNPSFGFASDLVGGADADIIAGSRLVDIKTRDVGTIERNDVRQLLTYAMLIDFARRGGADLPQIETISFLLSRQATLVEIDLGPARRHRQFARTREWLVDYAARLGLSRRSKSAHPPLQGGSGSTLVLTLPRQNAARAPSLAANRGRL